MPVFLYLLMQVGDIKRLNGLTTDLQMFALKTLRIPLPGRHPPSAALTSPVRSRLELRHKLHFVVCLT